MGKSYVQISQGAMRLRFSRLPYRNCFRKKPTGIVVGIGEVLRRDFDALGHRGGDFA